MCHGKTKTEEYGEYTEESITSLIYSLVLKKRTTLGAVHLAFQFVQVQRFPLRWFSSQADGLDGADILAHTTSHALLDADDRSFRLLVKVDGVESAHVVCTLPATIAVFADLGDVT